MSTKQSEFYTELKQETEKKIQTYKDFQCQIVSIQTSSKQKIKALQADMKAIAKQVTSNNKILKERGQEAVSFTK